MARKIEVEIVGDASSLSKTFKKAGDDADSFGKKASSGLATIGKASLVAGGALAAGVVVGLKMSVSAAMEAEQAEARLDQAFKAAGVSAKDKAAAMDAVAATSRTAAMDDEALSDVLARLTRSTGDVTKATEGMSLAAEIARGRNVSLEAASKAVEKAMLGNDQALKRMGVTVPQVTDATDALKQQIDFLRDKVKGADDAEKEAIATQIDALTAKMKHAREIDKQATATDALEKATKQFAGSSKAYGETAAGAQERLKVAFENLQETVGAKVLPAFTGMLVKLNEVVAWAEANWPRFERAALDAWAKVKKAGQDVADWYRANLQETVEKTLDAIRDAWQKWGDDIQRIASTSLSKISTEYKGRLKEITATTNTMLALARGDWEDGWEHLRKVAQTKLQQTSGIARGEIPIFSNIGRAIGKAIADGIGGGIASAAQWVWDKLREIGGIITGWAGTAYAYAFRIGSQIVNGIIGGLGGLASRLAGFVSDQIGKAFSWIDIPGGSPPEHAAEELVGKKITDGIVNGITELGRLAGDELSAKIKEALDKAEDVVEGRRERFKAAFGTLASAAGDAFDAITGEMKTPAEKQLALIASTEAEKSRLKEVADAKAAMTAAQTDEEKLAAAERFRQAELAIEVARLEGLAAEERKQLDARVALKREKFEVALANLQTQLEKEGASHKESHTKILALFKKFGVDYEKSGAAMGQAFVDGIKSKVGAVERAAESLAKAAAKYNQLKSPAEKGPLSTVDKWWKPLPGMLAAQLSPAPVERAAASVAGAAPRSGGSGGGTQVFQLVLDRKVIAEVVRSEMNRVAVRNGTSPILNT